MKRQDKQIRSRKAYGSVQNPKNQQLKVKFVKNKNQPNQLQNYPQSFSLYISILHEHYSADTSYVAPKNSKRQNIQRGMTLEQFLLFCQEFQLTTLPKISFENLAQVYQCNSSQTYGMNLPQFEKTLCQISDVSFGNTRISSIKNKNANTNGENIAALFKYMQITNDYLFYRKLDRLGVKVPQHQDQRNSNKRNAQYTDQADVDKMLSSYLQLSNRSRSLASLKTQNTKNLLQNNLRSPQPGAQYQSGSYAELYKESKIRKQSTSLINQQSGMKLNKIVQDARKAYAGQRNTKYEADTYQRDPVAAEPRKMSYQLGTNSMVFVTPNNFDPEQQTSRYEENQRINQINKLKQLRKIQREQDLKRKQEIKKLEQIIKQQKLLSEITPKTDSDKLSDLKIPKLEPKNNQVAQKVDICNTTSSKKSYKNFAQLVYSQFQKTQKPKIKFSIERIRNSILGFNTKYVSPFNFELQAVYVDHTATNRPCRGIERMIEFAKKTIANPHTEFSHYGKYSTELMHYAQDSLLKSFSVDTKNYVALPAGSGSTGAIEKCMKMLKSIEAIDNIKPTVFMTPYEHHSNILPWVEFYDDVKVLPSDEDQNLKIDQVYKMLSEYPAEKIIVSVSAASNVTSQITPILKLNQVIKRVKKNKQVVFCTDCAAFCPHHALDLSLYDQIDFAFLSPHKNLGGSQSCGVLVAKKQAAVLAKPTFPGGGTVNFVKGFKKQDVVYDQDIFAREIAGTPPFLGFYRAALSFELLHSIGYDLIHERQKRNTLLFLQLINKNNQRVKAEGIDTKIEVYGDQNYQHRANVITFNFTYGQSEYLNHSVASLIFTDVFGIQLRSGCFCAGPFGNQLLHVNNKIMEEIQNQIRMGIIYRKPGYLRLDLTFYLQPYQIEYIAEACATICKYWQKISKFYTICSNGQIIRHQFIKTKKIQYYSLENIEIIHKYLYENESIADRQQTLKRQMENGKQLMKDPINFMKKKMEKNDKALSEKSGKSE